MIRNKRYKSISCFRW